VASTTGVLIHYLILKSQSDPMLLPEKSMSEICRLLASILAISPQTRVTTPHFTTQEHTAPHHATPNLRDKSYCVLNSLLSATARIPRKTVGQAPKVGSLARGLEPI